MGLLLLRNRWNLLHLLLRWGQQFLFLRYCLLLRLVRLILKPLLFRYCR